MLTSRGIWPSLLLLSKRRLSVGTRLEQSLKNRRIKIDFHLTGYELIMVLVFEGNIQLGRLD
jgi:hypothetical protein